MPKKGAIREFDCLDTAQGWIHLPGDMNSSIEILAEAYEVEVDLAQILAGALDSPSVIEELAQRCQNNRFDTVEWRATYVLNYGSVEWSPLRQAIQHRLLNQQAATPSGELGRITGALGAFSINPNPLAGRVLAIYREFFPH